MNKDFIDNLKNLLSEFDPSICKCGQCSECPLNNDILWFDRDVLSICTLLDMINDKINL